MFTETNFWATSIHFSLISGSRKKVLPTAVLFMKMKAKKPRISSEKMPQPKASQACSRAAADAIRAEIASCALTACVACRVSRQDLMAGMNSAAVASTTGMKRSSHHLLPASSDAMASRTSEVAPCPASTQAAAKRRAACDRATGGLG